MRPVPSHLEMACTDFHLQGLEVSESNTTYLVRVNNNHYHTCEFRRDIRIDTSARILLPPGFYMEEMKRDKFCMFRALAHLWCRDSEQHIDVRLMIVRYMIFNWGRPWLISQCRWAIPEYFILPRYLERSPMLYGQETREPFWNQGDIPELVAAGRMAGCHIMVMVHKAVGDKFLSTIQISINGLEVRRDNTFHLLRVADGRFHALELAPNDEAPDEPSNIQRGGSFIRIRLEHQSSGNRHGFDVIPANKVSEQ
jgi:hypothetical protein